MASVTSYHEVGNINRMAREILQPLLTKQRRHSQQSFPITWTGAVSHVRPVVESPTKAKNRPQRVSSGECGTYRTCQIQRKKFVFCIKYTTMVCITYRKMYFCWCPTYFFLNYPEIGITECESTYLITCLNHGLAQRRLQSWPTCRSSHETRNKTRILIYKHIIIILAPGCSTIFLISNMAI